MFMNNFDVAGGASFGGGSATDAAARNVPQEELIDGAAWEMAQSEEEWLSQVGTNQEFQEELQAMIAPRDNAPHPYQYVNNSDELEAVVAQVCHLRDHTRTLLCVCWMGREGLTHSSLLLHC